MSGAPTGKGKTGLELGFSLFRFAQTKRGERRERG